MRLERLHIDLCSYGLNEGKYTGSAKFCNAYGGVEIVLSPEVSDKILAIVGDAVVDNAREVAQKLTAATLTQVPALEDRG